MGRCLCHRVLTRFVFLQIRAQYGEHYGGETRAEAWGAPVLMIFCWHLPFLGPSN